MKHAVGRATALILTLMLGPVIAQAHVGVQTVTLIAGVLHPWINLDSGLVLIGLALWLTQVGTSTDVNPMVANGLGITAGVAGGLLLKRPAPLWLLCCVALAAGLCVSLRVKLRPLLQLIALSSAALLAGYYAGVDAAPDVKTPLVFLLGVLAGSFVVPLSISVILGERKSDVVKIGIRILGSWIAAISLMLFALRLRG